MASSFVFRARRRLRREIDARRADVEIRQIRDLQRAYAQPGPDVLLIGDSAMFWVSPHDPDHRTLAQMVSDELGGTRVHAVVGAGYNPRVVDVFLDVLAGCAHRPRYVVVPTSLLMATRAWLAHPNFGYEVEAPALRAMVARGEYPKRVPRAGQAEWERFDKLPADSLFGARRTVGEIRLMTNALPGDHWFQPVTTWQQVVRLRHILDQYNAERFTPESPGVALVEAMGARLHREGYASMAYISPVNRDVLVKVLKQLAVDHVAANAKVVADAFTAGSQGSGTVVDATLACPEADFGDHVHLNTTGRLHLAGLLADAIRSGLE